MTPQRLSSVALLMLAWLFGPVSASFSQKTDPAANPRAVVTAGQARFTILTPRLIRMEWSANGSFEDRASLVFINRSMPVPPFSRSEENGWITLRTEGLQLRYKKGSGRFRNDNLEVLFDLGEKQVTWHPGMKNEGNLGGTIRTLDGVKGATPLEPGLLSRDGWVVVDDSRRPLFDASDWPWVVPRADTTGQDFYFFGYGHDFREELFDFTRVAGKIPMPPRFAFGLWWSRYWAYTDEEFKDLVREFGTYDVPLDVLVIDMDWHLTFNQRWWKKTLDQAGERLGWTGYTWDRNYFPDPGAFLAWCERHGLKTPLNLHPASGIQPHEEHYPEMARAMGIDPSTKRYVPFDITDKKFTTNYLNLIIRPLERQGVDFWWLDWQQWSTTKIPGVTPTWWLNYVFFTDMERRNQARPLLFHRWGGLGNHRYEIGFSGDVINVWESLAFQPYFTATAANVGYGYWSHDIGGHMPGPEPPELYTRWIQWGIFSPIIRTHTTKNPAAERRMWAYPPEYFKIMRDAILLRYKLIPYIYTESRKAYETGISICRPMYYDYPDVQEAYDFTDQYMFGDEMLLAPVTTPVSEDSLLASKTIWLPQGEWIEWFTGAKLKGPAVVQRSYALDEIPVFVKAGAIIPMQPKMGNTHERPVDPLILTVFPGDSGSTRVYEDEGNSLGYQKGEFAWTAVRMTAMGERTFKIDILPREGKYPGMLSKRAYELQLPGWWPPQEVLCNGQTIEYSSLQGPVGWCYDGDKLTTTIRLPTFDVSRKVEVIINLPASAVGKSSLLDGARGLLARLRRVMPLLNSTWPKEWSPEILVRAAQTGNRIGLHPADALSELEGLQRDLPELIKQIRALDIDPVVRGKVLNHLSKIAGN
jgi:alpha-glucosidase (family GH31 glycosyl hydrolase)